MVMTHVKTAIRSVLVGVFFLVLAPGALWAQDGLPDGITAADVDTFRTAMIAAGCEIRNDDQAAIVEAATGFGEDKLSALVAYMMGNGELLITENVAGFGMINDQCGGEDNDD